MSVILKGLSYSYNRNIGWQDRTIRIALGVGATVAAVFLYPQSLLSSLLLGIFALAQLGTALSARCMLCYFAGKCTIDAKERDRLDSKGIVYEIPN